MRIGGAKLPMRDAFDRLFELALTYPFLASTSRRRAFVAVAKKLLDLALARA